MDLLLEWELGNVCPGVCAVIESKHRLRNWELSIFPFFFFFPLLDQLCRTERQVRLLFFFFFSAWLLLSEWNQHWKFPPLIITATKSLSLSPAHMSRTNPHTHITRAWKGTTRTQEMLPGNNMRAYCTQTGSQSNKHTHTRAPPLCHWIHPPWSQRGQSGRKANPEVCRWCVEKGSEGLTHGSTSQSSSRDTGTKWVHLSEMWGCSDYRCCQLKWSTKGRL